MAEEENLTAPADAPSVPVGVFSASAPEQQQPDTELPPEEEEEEVDTPAQQEAPAPGAALAAAVAPRRYADEKRQYWRKVLTGNPATVPAAVRRQSGVDAWDAPEEQKQYRMLATINRSWAADHLPHATREQVSADWPRQRARLARQLRVRNNEQEVFLALSQEEEDAPRRDSAQRITNSCFMAGLEGRDLEGLDKEFEGLSEEDARHARLLAEATYEHGRSRRSKLGDLPERIAQGLDAFAAVEDTAFPAPRVISALPDLLHTVDALADLDDDTRNAALYLAAGMMQQKNAAADAPGLVGRVMQSLRRGSFNMGHSLLQGASHASIAMLHRAGSVLESEGLNNTAHAWDKRMQVLESLRHLSQDELRPLVQPGEKAASYLINATEQVPAALLSCCGGAGFAALTLGAVGDSVAQARARAPLADQELQLYAGLLAGSIQAGIYMNLNRVGGRLLEQSISGLGRAGGRGIAGYTLAGLNTMGSMTTEAARLLAAGKLAAAADLGAQEIAARLSQTASNIDWRSFGDNLTDIEVNMHEAAGLLPFLLLGSGRLGLEHFRSSRAILGEGRLLERLGIRSEQVDTIMQESKLSVRTELLREALAASRLFSGPADRPEIKRAMGLLHTDECTDLFTGDRVRDFLKLPPEDPVPLSLLEKQENTAPLLDAGTAGRQVEAMQIWNEWRELSPLGESDRGRRIVQDTPYDKENYTLNQLDAHEKLPYLSLADRQQTVNDCAEDIVRHSYLFLMNVYAVDTMQQDLRKDVNLWKSSADKARRKLLSEIVKAVAGICDGKSRKRCIGNLDRFMSDFSSTFKRDKYRPGAARRFTGNYIARIISRSDKEGPAYWLSNYPGSADALSVVRTMHRGVHMMADLIPQMPDFQTALTRGMAPGPAAASYVSRILGMQRSHTDVRCYSHIRNVTPMQEYSARNAASYETYRRLTGYDLEEALAADGHTYIRGRRVDGSMTHWHETPQQAINDIVGNAALEYTDLGRPVYTPESLGSRGSKINLMNPPVDTDAAAFTKADQTCSLALSELGTLWHGTATSMQPGLNIRDRQRYFKAEGRYRAVYSPLTANGESFSATHIFTNTPIAMAQTRFETSIRRQIMSGYVNPLELMKCLVQRGYVGEEKLQELREEVSEDYNFSSDGKVYNPRRLEDRDASRALEDVVRTATGYALDYFLGMQASLRYPRRIGTWVASQAFYPDHMRRDTKWVTGDPRDTKVTKWANQAAADFMRARLDSIEQVRTAAKDADHSDILSELMEDMLSLDGVRNYEQGWRYHAGGDRGSLAIFCTPQYYWNLLRAPLRTWNTLGARQAEPLRKYVEELCSQVSFFADRPGSEPLADRSIRLLDDMLRKYPEMHRYSASRVDEGRLCRMELQPAAAEEYADGMTQPPQPLYRRDKMRSGYTLEHLEKMPDFIVQEPGGNACMLLLDHLRSYIVQRPMADSTGIWWKDTLYGQHGKTPAGLENAHVSIHPIIPLLDKLREAGTLAAQGQPMSICGTELNGIQPDMKVGILGQATTYRVPGDNSRVYRLMPGDPILESTSLRAPYVVQCERGAYLGYRGIVRDKDDMNDVCIPLHRFTPSEYRIMVDGQGDNWARRGYEDTLENIMALTWAPSESMAHKSAYMLEYLLRLGEDSGFSQVIAQKQLSECGPEEAALLNLIGDLVSTICADDPTAAIERLRSTAERYRNGEYPMMQRMVDYLSSLRHHPAAYAAPPATAGAPAGILPPL